MKIILQVLVLSFVFNSSFAWNPMLMNTPKEKESVRIEKLVPLSELYSFFEDIYKECDQYPSPAHFQNAVLNGVIPGVKCKGVAKIQLPKGKRSPWKLGKDIPYIVKFLKDKNFKFYSSEKEYKLLITPDKKSWVFKYFDIKEYELLIVGLGKWKYKKRGAIYSRNSSVSTIPLSLFSNIYPEPII